MGLTGLLLPWQWMLALGTQLDRESGGSGRYGRWCVALAVIDTLTVAVVVLLSTGVLSGPRVEGSASAGLASEGARGLFEAQAGPGAEVADPLWSLLGILALFTGFFLLAGRRAGGSFAMGVAVASVLFLWALCASLAPWLVNRLAGGWTSGGMLIGIALSSLVGGIASTAWIRRMRQRELLPLRGSLRIGRSLSCFLVGLLYLAAAAPRAGLLSVGLAGLMGALGVESSTFHPGQLFGEVGLPPYAVWCLVALIVLVAPWYEELLFRGLMLPWLVRGLGPIGGVLSSALLFGVMHAHYGPFVLVTTAYGIVLGWAGLRTGGVLAPWLLHVAVNAVGSATLWWPLVAGD
jgi:membrane protease YdiL (CAAX protease family)